MTARRVLVANRGEIACRIIRTLDRMGLESVAVFTEPDRDSMHCDLATVARSVGGPDGYLAGERIVKVALDVGADVIHPGYGFLAEDAEFAAAVEESGMCFVGPDPRPDPPVRAQGRRAPRRRPRPGSVCPRDRT